MRALTIWLTIFLIALIYGQGVLKYQDNRHLRVEFQLPELEQGDITINHTLYTRLDYPDAYFTQEEGAPMIPYSIITVAVPPGATVRSQYQILQESSLSPIDVLPNIMISSLEENNLLPRNDEIYNSSTPYPGYMVEVSEPYRYRHMQLVDIRIYPVQYQPAEHSVRLLKKMAVDIQFQPGKKNNGKGRLTEDDILILKNRVLNFQSARNWVMSSRKMLSKTLVNYDLSVGDWYKIPISNEGIYKITGSFLQDHGIDISQIDVNTIQLFNYGGAPLPTNAQTPRPEDLNEVAIEVQDNNQNGILDATDVIYFYGRSVDGWQYNTTAGKWLSYHNQFSFTNYYLFTFNQRNGKRIPRVNSPSLSNAVRAQQFTDYRHFETDRYNILSSGMDWYWVRLQGTSDQADIDFQLPQNIVTQDVEFCARFHGGSGSHYGDPQNYTYTVNVAVNGETLINNLTFSKNATKDKCVTSNGFQGGSNQLSLTYSGNIESAFMFLDYFNLQFQRNFVAENNRLKFYYMVDNTPREFFITGLPTGTNKVWDISDFANITAITPLDNGATVRFHAQENQPIAKTYYVFAPAAATEITDILRINNHANLRDPNRKGKLLLIVPKEFYDAAEAIENFKETQFPNPLETERVTLEDIYSEFSSCVPDPTAIRDFIKYAFNNWGQNDPNRFRPEYIWLIGDGSYDYRNIELTNYQNRVPVFEITANDDVFSRVSDNYFTAINNSKNDMSNLFPELSIGRLPANSVNDIQTYLQKLAAYSRSFQGDDPAKGWQTRLTFVADDECQSGGRCGEWFHMQQTENIVSLVPHKFDLTKIYLTDFPTEAGGLGRLKPQATAALLNQINRGTLVINFFGHGDPNTWAHEQVLNKGRDLPKIQNGYKLPIWIAATCTWGKYDNPNIPSMAEAMVWTENAGGIEVIAAARPVFAFQNEQFVQKLFRHLFNQGDNSKHSQTVGRAMLSSLGGGSNDQKYHILGDPTLRLADPEYMIHVTQISADTLKALSTATISAVITDTTGATLSGFNGKAVIRVFDAVDSLFKGGVHYTYPGGTIFRGVVTVENGELQGSFIVPKSIKYKNSRTGRISIYAWSEEMRDGVGFVDTLLFTGTESRVSDANGPNIDFVFPDQPDFFDGDYVGQQPTLLIHIEDESGVNLTGEVGHRIELTIDNQIKKDVTDFFVYKENSFQEGELVYTLPALPAGTHHLTISAWDNLNNYSEAQLTFTTASATDLTLDRVLNYPNPFSDDTQFTFQFQSSSGTADVTIKIYTINGRLIQELEDVAQPGFNKIYWDGRDRDGNLIANGVYLYKIIVDDGEKTVEKIEKLAVVR